ncbi:MAG: chloramphenicol phosphotransferase CPT family protein [Chloroflexota bacterium]|nr:chloramphenicol phosphotransferase CPT family protein [Chloroflexota bacterium]MDQ5867405.1 chloramphenicol phosphotransferase CPT family protein [Chloroflexota bacterium]
MAEPGNIVFLNGTSSAGKTSISRALQNIMPTPMLRTGMDHFCGGAPISLFVCVEADGERPAEVDGWLEVYRDGTLVELPRIGPVGKRLLAGMYQAIAAVALVGNDVIVDDMIYDPEVLRSAVVALKDLPVLFVGVHVPVDIARQRELERGDRSPGGAAIFLEHVHVHDTYDLELDTSTMTPEECAARIKTALESGHPRTALRKLAGTFGISGSEPDKSQS